ncbi:MAG: TetR/AcrR family transcriptional regulator [Blautia sp.]|nr:TetR/AcrR family transcriptional regulator [Blautia sp.]
MPPKPKYTKEEIVNAAYEVTREKGIDAVVAREVGKRLNTSASPIFTVWNSMEELREEVWKLAKQKYQEYMADIFDYTPAFKEFGMRWVSFAAEEPNLYRLLFLSQRNEHSPYLRFKLEFESIIAPLVEEIRKIFGLSEKDAEDLLNQMIIFANGIAAFVITDADSFFPEAVSHDLSQVCIGIVLTDKFRDGSIDMATAKEMADSCERGITPQKK